MEVPFCNTYGNAYFVLFSLNASGKMKKSKAEMTKTKMTQIRENDTKTYHRWQLEGLICEM